MEKLAKHRHMISTYYLSDNTHVSNTYRWKPKRNINQVVMDTFLWLKKNKPIIKKYFYDFLLKYNIYLQVKQEISEIH